MVDELLRTKRYVQVRSGKIVDTALIVPHTECYWKRDNNLYAETISDGSLVYLGIIEYETDDIKDFGEHIS